MAISDTETKRAYAKRWRMENPDYHKEWRKAHPGYTTKYPERTARYIKANPVKIAARTAVNNALKSGKLSKPDICTCCSGQGRTEAHHPDYSKKLEVVWLCKMCHTGA